MKNRILPEGKEGGEKVKLKMNILISAYGSQGDVTPAIAIAEALKQKGHFVKAAVCKGLEYLAIRKQIDFCMYPGDTAKSQFGRLGTGVNAGTLVLKRIKSHMLVQMIYILDKNEMVFELRKYSMAKTRFCLIGVLCLLLNTLAADFRKVTMDNSQIRPLISKENGKEYEILAGTPWSYQDQTKKKYPVIYMLDGQWDFAKLNSMYGALYSDKAIPEFIIIGISYAGKDSDYPALRSHDYTPIQPKDEKMKMGGAPKFLAFIEKELIPFVESNYRTDSSFRVLAGACFGGLFSLYTLFNKPTLFQAHIAISPPVSWGNRYAFALEKDFNRKNDALANTLWISVGGAEHGKYIKSVRNFTKQIKASNYKGLNTSFRVIEGMGHAGSGIEAYARSVIAVFQPLLAVQEKE